MKVYSADCDVPGGPGVHLVPPPDHDQRPQGRYSITFVMDLL